MRICRRASRLHDEDIAAANVLIDLKIELPVRERSAYAFPMSQFSWRQISSANWGFALPEKTLMPPVVLIALRLPIADCRFSKFLHP